MGKSEIGYPLHFDTDWDLKPILQTDVKGISEQPDTAWHLRPKKKLI